MDIKRRALNLMISTDQFVFSLITLGRSDPDETMSSAAYRLEQEGRLQGKWFRPLIDKLFWFDPEHCKKSWEAEQK